MANLRIINTEVDGNIIPISPLELNSSEPNFYTVIIGNNASGKSRLLVSILNKLRQTGNYRLKSNDSDICVRILYDGVEHTLSNNSNSSDNIVERINLVSISNSLFDKFPHKAKSDKNYSYVGSRMSGISTHKRAIINDLMDIFSLNLENETFIKKAKQLFTFLNLDPTIKISLRFSFIASQRRLDDLLENISSVKKLQEYLVKISKQGFYRQQTTILEKYTDDIDFLKGLQAYLKNNSDIFKGSTRKRFQRFKIDLTDSKKNKSFIEEYVYFSLLRRLNILTYDYIKLKKGIIEYDIHDSSTGEIGLLITFLRAIPEMKSNSIIFIDEPEISLHPSWQMKYIDLLRSFLSGYSNCHIIIATHSHFLLSDLREQWSSVVVLNKNENKIKGELKKYTPFGWSPEAILYEVFGVANVRNHYLEYDLKKMLSLISNRKGTVNEIQSYIEKIQAFEYADGDPLNLIIKEAKEYVKKKKK